MKTIEIKKKLIDEINLLTDRDLLEELYRFLNLENKIEELFMLNKEQKAAIMEGREQIANGDYLTNDEAIFEMREWLNRK